MASLLYRGTTTPGNQNCPTYIQTCIDTHSYSSTCIQHMHAYSYIHVYIHNTYIQRLIYLATYTNPYVCLATYIHMYSCMFVYIYTQKHTCIPLCMSVYIYTYVAGMSKCHGNEYTPFFHWSFHVLAGKSFITQFLMMSLCYITHDIIGLFSKL